MKQPDLITDGNNTRKEMKSWFIVDKKSMERVTFTMHETGNKTLLPVFIALCYHADRHRKAFPGYRTIMHLTGIASKSTITRAMHLLEAAGVITRQRQPGRVCRYRLRESMSDAAIRSSIPSHQPQVIRPGEQGGAARTTGCCLVNNRVVQPGQQGVVPGVPEEEVLKRTTEDLPMKRKGQEEICAFIHHHKGDIDPREYRIVEGLLTRVAKDAVIAMVEELFQADPVRFRRRGVLPLQEVAESC